MKKTTITIASIILCFTSFAQNLINNSGFENYNACPPDIGWGFTTYITYADFWDFSSPSPDYFHTCGGPNASVPDNFFGNQLAASGNGYVGFVAYQSTGAVNAREGVIIKLSDTLEQGQTYYCSFKISLAENSAWACNNIGMYFSTGFHQTPFSTQTYYNQVNVSQVYVPSIVSDSINWITVSGSFIADSSFLYVSITNHFDDVNTSVVATANPNALYSLAYYYLDDVCVSLNPNTCGYITSELNSTKNEIISRIYPNPVSETAIMELNGLQKQISVEIYSFDNQLLKRIRIENTNLVKIDVNDLPEGLYLVRVEVDSVSFYKKLIVE